MTNLVCKTLGVVSNVGGGSVELEKLIQVSPPSVRRELGQILFRQYKAFETLSFAPDQMIGNLKDKEDITQRVSDIEKTLLRVIDLGFDSGETQEEPQASA